MVVPPRGVAEVIKFDDRDALLKKLRKVYETTLRDLKMLDACVFVCVGGEVIFPSPDGAECKLEFPDGASHLIGASKPKPPPSPGRMSLRG